ncbi:DNA (cytosine-5)-methyltransferase 1 [Streptococcus gallinaceus]|uniref:DNA (cytosine-5-)-methyltransferase n=1 Tax=Streptococcus gallinaceus TaxID=165758 RepID=UPI0020A2151C|nr:DNA (cytosine-5-)-methyltransferase [Streptococcus gallinaceus]MCP1638598.1 DNA (cytosine-5)-methyltransferase 1 [Streptococcus gallinaceus]MCP1769315.1 DNA (cytosine-5)-methyltransferase 1 [Streptococcus gallinaceus]
MKKLTLGSLFDGSGGFPLAGQLVGIEPIWASEVEPFPILVTRKNIPTMKHLGDITTISGYDIPPVDIITFGSPCQDMSIAGKRDGLNGKSSSLFYEAIRIVKEMRWKTNGECPRFIIWENVLGAFSSNEGEDFRCVLEEIAKVKDENLSIPKPTKWQGAGSIVGASLSICWRVLDAQYFGVPQRRKRIFLVADFNSSSSGEILFESKSVPRDINSCESKKQGTARSSTSSTGKSSECLLFENHGQDVRYKGPLEVSNTVSSTYGTGGNNQPFVVGNFDVRLTSENTRNARANVYKTETSRTIDTGGNNPDRNQGGVAIVTKSYGISRTTYNQSAKGNMSFKIEEEQSATMLSTGPNAVATPTYSTSKNSHHTTATIEQASTLVASDYKDSPIVNDVKYVVRRLTPLECGRLQGFPDSWCQNLSIDEPSDEDVLFFRTVFETYRMINGKKKAKTDKQIIKWLQNPYSDTAEYKMWGNGVALPCVVYVMQNLLKNIEK